MKFKKFLLSTLGILIFTIALTTISKATNETITVTVPGKYDYEAAFGVLEIVNEERAAVGKAPLKMDKDLMEAAMLRSSEIALDFSHTRPDGTSCFSAVDKSIGMIGENIAAGSSTPEGIMKIWMNSTGHRENILRDGFSTIGIGMFKYGNICYWTQIFGSGNLNEITTIPQSKEVTNKIEMLTSNVQLYYNSMTDISKKTYSNGYNVDIVIINNGWPIACMNLQPSDLTFTSSNPSIFTVNSDGLLKCVSTGKATLTAKLKQNPELSVTEEITIRGYIADTNISFGTQQNYTGKAIKPSVTIKDGNKTLKNGTDYTVTYKNNTKVGKATIEIKGQGVYYGSVAKYFNIVSNTKKISSLKIDNISNKAYTGKNISIDVTIKDGKYKLKKGRDYTLAYANNKNTGKATITVTGKGKYTGSVKKYFYIVPKKVGSFKVKSQTTSQITLSWSKATGSSGYEVCTYDSAKKKWKSVGTTTKTSYTINKLKAGTNYKYKIRAYKTISGKKYYGQYTAELSTATKPSTAKISSLKTKSKTVTVNWKKVSNATGYEVYMATSKNGKYSKKTTVTSNKTVKYTVKKLKKNKTYYFKIRTYKTVNGKKVYGAYSSIKSIKAK